MRRVHTSHSVARTTGRIAGRLAKLVAAVVAVAALALGLATPGPAEVAPSRNPLAGHPWGVYRGDADSIYPAWQAARGTAKTLLGRMALRPRVRWFTSYIPGSEVRERVRDYISSTQHGNPNVLVPMATFRLWPHHESAKGVPLSRAAQRAYRQWVDNAALGIGSSRVALILEPDLAVTLTSWHPAVRMALARYAARRFSALPNTTVYLDAGSSDWLKIPDAVGLLRASGIGYVRGFALGATHHPSTGAELRYGRQLALALGRVGYRFKHFIVDTSDNGHPYTNGQFWAAHPHGDVNDPPACTARWQRVCVSLGIPPTANVTARRWHLAAAAMPAARYRCDGYLWIGRPWLGGNDSYFDRVKALNAARTSPFG